jgi:hypothetical protein
MAQNASDSQKVDYLWKKIVYGAAKTDISGNIDATNEPNPSPLQIRADKILQDSASIPGVIPGSNSSVVTVYPTTFPVECISTAAIPTPTLTWQTGRTFWVPPEFGSTYQIKVYIAPSGNAANVAGKGTQVFATGSGNNDLWVFDYQSGILNFNSNNTPYNTSNQPISFTGNSVYISGGVYAGAFGLPTTSNIGNVILGNITISNTTISTSITSANIYMTPSGNGVVQFGGNLAIGIPTGNTAQRPTTVALGYTRYNSETQSIELWTGNGWVSPGTATITSDVITPNGVGNTFTLSSSGTTTGVMVSINGTVQQPFTAYTVSDTSIIFTEVPLATDIVEVRHIVVGTATLSAEYLQLGTTKVLLDTANVNITGNLLPSANVTYDIGSPTLRWRTGYFSANTIDIGGGTIGLHTTLGFSFTTPGGTPQYMMPNGASTSNTFTSATTTIQGNLAVGGNITVNGNLTVLGTTTTVNTEVINQSEIIAGNLTAGNITANYIIGSGQFLTSLPGYVYSNVNVNAWFSANIATSLYSNVNVAAYLSTYTGAITGANLNVSGNILATGTTVAAANVNGSMTASGITQLTNLTNATGTGTGALQVTGGASIAKDLWVIGNIYTANLVGITSNIITIQDSLIYLNRANTYPYNYSIGMYSHYIGGPANTYVHTTVTRQPNDNTWWFISNIGEPSPLTGNINVYDTNRILDSIQAGNLNATGNILGASGILNSLTVNGGVTSTGYINTSANVSAAIGNFGNLNSAGAAITGINAIAPAGNAVVNLGSLSNQWATIYGTATTAQYADLAENYVADSDYVPGTVVDFGGAHEITISNIDMSSAVAGVVSEKPAYLMNSGQQGTHVIAVALQGRVFCKVTGTIRKGNMLVSAGNGIARAEKHPEVGTVLGKALEDFNGTQGTIEIVVGVR